jgi:phosphate-selective porin OprO/OprP
LALGLVLAALLPCFVAAEETTEEEPVSKFDMSKGGPTWSHGNNSVTLTLFTQVRFLAEDKEEFDADTTGTIGFGEEDSTSTGFKLARIRPGLRGTIFQPWVKYVVTFELSDTSGERDAKFKDTYVEFTKEAMANVRMGQFKVPFSLQELASDQHNLFVERSITNVFSPARDAGVMLSGRTEEKRFGFNLGAFNGAGESRSQDDEGLMYVARVFVDPFGEYKTNEGAQEMPEEHVLHVGAAFRTGEGGRGFDNPGVVEHINDQDAWNFELGWKWQRFYASGEYFSQSTEQQNPTAASDVDADGFHVQASVMTIPKRLELGARYAVVDANTDAAGSEATEIRGVGNWYWWGDSLKATFDLGTVEYEPNAPGRNTNGVTLDTGTRLVAGDVKDWVARFQIQFGF